MPLSEILFINDIPRALTAFFGAAVLLFIYIYMEITTK